MWPPAGIAASQSPDGTLVADAEPEAVGLIAAEAGCALIELRVFENGTYATRLIPAPNLYELAATAMHRLKDAPVSADAPDGAPGPPD